jgi:TonB-linked SusC/RagA family outer membrane protein
MQKATALSKKPDQFYWKKVCDNLNLPFLMKVSTCILLIVTLSANLLFAKIASAQTMEEKKITVEFRNVSLSEAIKKVEKLSGFRIAYSPTQVSKYNTVNLSKGTRSVYTVLQILLAATNFNFSQDGKEIIIFQKIVPKKLVRENSAEAPDILPGVTVRGKVTNEKGEPLAGAAVSVRKTRISKITNAIGEFELNGISSDAVLYISYIGYLSQELKVEGRTDIVVQLKVAISQLNNVSVTVVSNGYQTVSKERATGSFGVITGKELEETPSTNIYDKLQGKIPGVYTDTRRGATTNKTGTTPIIIRGKSTYSSAGVDIGPLIVIDGFPYYSYQSEDVLNSINPDDIDQITVLKDAAAASIWGMQAANGVIVVTTKKGKNNNAKPSISFSTSLGITGRPRLGTLNQMTSAQYIDLEKEMVTKSIITDPASYIYSKNVSQAETALFQYKRGNITLAQRDAQLDSLASVDNTNQIKKYLLQPAATQQYNMSVSGGSDNSTYYLSGYYYTDRPVYQSNINKGWAVTANNSYFLFNKRVTLNAGINYIGSREKSNQAAVNTLGNGDLGFHRYDNLVDATGAPILYSMRFTPAVLTGYESKGYMNWRYSPVNELNYSNSITNTNVVRVNIGLVGKVNSWLNLEASGNIERRMSDQASYDEPNSYTARNTVNYATSVNSTTGALVYGIPKGGMLTTGILSGRSYSARGQFTINKTWNKIHNLSALGGAEIRQVYYKNTATTLYGYDQSLGTNAAYNQITSYTMVTGSTNQIGNNNSISEITDRWLSYYSNASYSLLNRYIVSGSVRFDDMNMLGVARNKRAKPFWSTGIKWNIDKEAFMKNVKWLDALSLRATYGLNGAAPRNAVTVSTLTVASTADSYTGQTYATINTPANPNLGWETTRMINYGVDFSTFKRRLSGSVEYYTKRTTDIIYSEPINGTYGFTTLVYNTGSTHGHGWDVKISGIPLRGKNWEWSSTFIFSYNTNKVTDARLNTVAVSSITSGTPFVGYPMDYLFAYRWAGLDSTGQSQVYAADGKTKVGKNTAITDLKALKYAGRTTSPYFGGFQNTFSYKNLQLGIQMNWAMGSVFLRPSADNYPTASTYSGYIGKQKDLAYRWKAKGDELTTNVPGLTGINSNSLTRYKNADILVTNGSYVRLQQISLGYNLPEKWLRGNIFKSVNLSGVARDLGLIWRANKLGLDPVYQRSSTTVNDNMLPSVNYVFRLSANF